MHYFINMALENSLVVLVYREGSILATYIKIDSCSSEEVHIIQEKIHTKVAVMIYMYKISINNFVALTSTSIWDNYLIWTSFIHFMCVFFVLVERSRVSGDVLCYPWQSVCQHSSSDLAECSEYVSIQVQRSTGYSK